MRQRGQGEGAEGVSHTNDRDCECKRCGIVWRLSSVCPHGLCAARLMRDAGLW